MVVAATTKPLLLPEVRLSQEASYPAGLLRAVGRQVQREAVNSATGYTEHSSIGNMLYQSSLNKGGDFANQVISNIAQGNYGQVGSTGEQTHRKPTPSMGINPDGGSSQDNVKSAAEGSPVPKPEAPGNRDFALYHADQYAAPTQGSYSTVQSVDVPPGTSSMHRIRSKKHHILPAAAK